MTKQEYLVEWTADAQVWVGPVVCLDTVTACAIVSALLAPTASGVIAVRVTVRPVMGGP